MLMVLEGIVWKLLGLSSLLVCPSSDCDRISIRIIAHQDMRIVRETLSAISSPLAREIIHYQQSLGWPAPQIAVMVVQITHSASCGLPCFGLSMHFTYAPVTISQNVFGTFIFVAITALLATAAPTSNANIDVQGPLPSSCASKGNNAGEYKSFETHWGVWEIKTMMPSAIGTCGYAGGFLDNLRAWCGAIWDWQAVPDLRVCLLILLLFIFG